MASRAREHGVVIACVAIAVVQFAAALWNLEGWIRLPFTLLLVFAVPGTLEFLAVRRRLPDTIIHAGIACAASLGTTILIGFPLSALPHGYSRVGWSTTMVLLVAALAVIATLREPVGRRDEHEQRLAIRMPSAATLVGLVVCVGLVVGGAVVSLSSQHTAVAKSHFTELWLTPHTGKLPTVHVRNQEGATTSYRVVTVVDSQHAVSRTIKLAAGASWSGKITGAAPAGGPMPAVGVNLYRIGTPGVYRHVFITGTV